MKTRHWLETVRFELAHQLKRKTTWVLFGLFLFPLVGVTTDDLADAPAREVLFNAPLQIAEEAVVIGLVALLILAVVAGDAATRDIRTRVEPLMHAAPVGRAAYLGGRFVGAFIVAAMLVTTVPLVRILVPLFQPELAEGVVGPSRPAAYLESYVLLMLPNAFVATALLFSLATLVRHGLGGWLGAALVFLATQVSHSYLGEILGRWDLAQMLDPSGMNALEVMSRTWSPVELNQRLIGSEAVLLWNRALWLVVAFVVLWLTYRRFDFGGEAGTLRWWQKGPLRTARQGPAQPDASDPVRPIDAAVGPSGPVTVPRAARKFGATGRVRQTLAIARDSLREMTPAWIWLALPLMVVLQMVVTLEVLGSMGAGTPVLPTTDLVVQTLGAGEADAPPPVVLAMFLLPVLLAGELIWRERDANMEALADATPVPDGVRFLGKLLALWFVLVALFALLMLAGVLSQISLGWYDIDLGLYVRLLGLRLIRPLLFALFALSVHVLVDQKHLGHVVVLLLAAPLLPQLLGLEHPLLLIWDQGWRYSPIRGFEPFLGPVLWFDLYWAGWALLVACVARLFWVRGEERGLRRRLRVAQRRFRGRMRGIVAGAGALVLLTGGFIFYNTNILNSYRTSDERAEALAEYERRYGGYRGAPQPRLTATDLDVEIYPDRREADVRGVHLLVNRTRRPVDTIHVATSLQVETRTLEFDRAARAVLVDDELGHRIYLLEERLEPGDSLRMSWRVHHDPRGFPARGVSTAVVGNGTFIEMPTWTPLVGYQPRRELSDAGRRREHGLPAREAVPSLYDLRARSDPTGRELIDLQVTVGTAADQLAVAPGELLRTWTEGGRRYYRYAPTAPVKNEYVVFSADYAVRAAVWDDVRIEVLYHPPHDGNVDRMIRSMEASLEQLTERFGPYPYRSLRMVEYPRPGGSLHAEATTIWYQELFPLFDPTRDPRRIDLSFAVTAHEVAHQWWGSQGARVEGLAFLSESLAWYSAMGVIEEAYGTDHLERFLGFMRESYLTPRSRAGVPLLRASDPFLAYRKGPFAMYALREYVGRDGVDRALRGLRTRYAASDPPYATSLDLYEELRQVTPDSLHSLLGDLLERNTFWELTAERATVEPASDDQWRVALEVEARKVVVDTLGAETDVPMDDLVEIGVYGPAGADGEADLLHLATHRIRSGPQTIEVTVSGRPARAGIDPRHLLVDVRPWDNVADVADPSPDIPTPSPGR